MSNKTILVTGCTGFIGSKLISRLARLRYNIVGMSRKSIINTDDIRYVRADVFELDDLIKAMRGVDVAYYLLHSMEGNRDEWQQFVAREKIQAQNFLKAATTCGVKRIIYLGGLVDDSLKLSPHMKSRIEVGKILASGNIPVTEFRASIIIGAQGGSFTMLRYLVERLSVMICPSWVNSLAQPIALDDVIEYLVRCIEIDETKDRIFEIGGPEQLRYKDLLYLYAKYLNKNIYILQIPFLTTRLSSYWVDLVTPVKAALARPLVDSLVHDTIVIDNSIHDIIPLKLESFTAAVATAVREMKDSPPSIKLKEKTGLCSNQRILQVSLVVMMIIGTTYYWLDDRSDVYHVYWLSAAFLWYVSGIFAIVLIQRKTRLGYLVAGVLSWITLAFWLFDNYYIAFDGTVIASIPNDIMTSRNFVGIAIAAISVVASHNLFHKITKYQFKGRPV